MSQIDLKTTKYKLQQTNKSMSCHLTADLKSVLKQHRPPLLKLNAALIGVYSATVLNQFLFQ